MWCVKYIHPQKRDVRHPLYLLDLYVAVAGVDGEGCSSTVKAAVQVVRFPAAAVVVIHDDGEGAVEVAVAGVHIEIGGKARRHAKGNRSIGGLNAGSLGELGAFAQIEIEMPIAGVNGEGVKDAVYSEIRIAGAGIERAAGAGNVDLAVSGLEAQIARDMIEANVAIASGQVDIAMQAGEVDAAIAGLRGEGELGGRLHRDGGALMPIHADVKADVLALPDVEMHLVSGLALLDVIVAELPAFHFDVDADGVAAFTGRDRYAGVGGLEVQRGLAADGIRLRPEVIGVLRKGGECGGRQSGNKEHTCDR